MNKIKELYKKAPRLDKDGFHESFSLDESDKIKSYFHEHGYVVVRDILDVPSCNATVSEIWDILEGKCVPPSGVDRDASSSSVKRDDPSTHDKSHGWPNYTEYGILGKIIASSPCSWKNRHNPKLYALYRLLLGTPRLFCKIDRYGIVRPTVSVKHPDGRLVDYPDRSTQFPIHWDVNIYNYVNRVSSSSLSLPSSSLSYSDLLYENNKIEHDPLIIQGILALKDCSFFDGGFQCIPGFHSRSRLESFVSSHPSSSMKRFNSSVLIDPSDPILDGLVRVPVRAGSFICFNSLLPHASFPNSSSSFRIVQYMRFYPSRFSDSRFSSYLSHRCSLLRQLIPSSMLDDPFVRRIHGFEDFPS